MLADVSLSTGTASFVIALVLIIVAVIVAWVLIKSGVLTSRLSVDATAFAEAQTTMQRQEIDIRDLQEKNREKDVTIAALEAKVEVLEDIVTARDLITKGFKALGVREEDLV